MAGFVIEMLTCRATAELNTEEDVSKALLCQ